MGSIYIDPFHCDNSFPTKPRLELESLLHKVRLKIDRNRSQQVKANTRYYSKKQKKQNGTYVLFVDFDKLFVYFRCCHRELERRGVDLGTDVFDHFLGRKTFR